MPLVALQHLFIGGEGTLGLVTEAEIKLERQPQNLQVLVLGVPDFDAVMPVLHAFQKDIDLTAFEFFGELAMQKVLDHGHVQRPFETQCPFYVLLEFEAHMSRYLIKQWKFSSIVWNRVGCLMA